MKKQIFLSIATLFIFLFMVVGVSLVSAFAVPDVNSSEMLIYYRLNNDSAIGENDTFIVDLSGHYNSTMVVNITFNSTDGAINIVDGSAEFNGNNSYIRVASTTLVSNLGYTLSFWLYTNPSTVNQRATTFRNTWTMYWGATGDGGTDFVWYPGNGSSYTNGQTAGKFIEFGKWQMITITYNLTQGRLYKNGMFYQSYNSISSIVNTSIGSSGNLCIGTTESGGTSCLNQYLNGSIDEYIIYNRSLSDQEVWDLYNNYNDCVYPWNDVNLNLYYSTKLCNDISSYNFNDSASDGIIVLKSNDIVLDMNGVKLFANSNSSSPSPEGVKGPNVNNITIKNGDFELFWSGVTPGGDNWTMYNLTFNNSFYGLDFENAESAYLGNSTFTDINSIGVYANNLISVIMENLNITMHNQNNSRYTIWMDGTNNNNNLSNLNLYGGPVKLGTSTIKSYFKNSNIKNVNRTSEGIVGTGTNWTIQNNLLVGTSARIHLSGGSNGLVRDNKIYNITTASSCIAITTGHNNAQIINNTVDNCDIGIWVGKFDGLTVENNTVLNTYNWFDFYAMGIVIETWGRNFVFRGNNVTNFGLFGIGIKNGTNGIIENNDLSALINRTNLTMHNYYEPQGGIAITPDYEGFSGDGLATGGWNATNWFVYNSNNITITNNTVVNTDLFLLVKGTTNLTHDFTNSVYRSFEAPYYKGRHELWFRTTFQNLSRVNSSHEIETNARICSLTNCSFQYEEYSTYSKYTNWNASASYQFNIYSLTNALIYNTNNSIYGNSDISLNDGNINITLTPNNASYVLNNFNLTEGINREHSPIWFSSLSSTSKHIASNLTNTVDATLVVLVTKQPSSIYYESNTSIFNYTLNNLNWTYNDLAKTITINLTGIEPSTNSNVLSITYPRDNGGGGGGSSSNPSTIAINTSQFKNITAMPISANLSALDYIRQNVSHDIINATEIKSFNELTTATKILIAAIALILFLLLVRRRE